MTARSNSFDRALAELLAADGPQAMPAGFLEGPIGAAAATSQRRPLLRPLDSRAWPPAQPLGLSPVAFRILALAALLALAVVAAVVGANLLRRSEEVPGSVIVWVPDTAGGGVVRQVAADGTIVRSFELPPLRHCPRLLPDGQHVAYWQASDNGGLVLQALDGSASTAVGDTTFRDPGTEMWSPDGWRVALRFQTLRIVDASNGSVLRPDGGDGLRAVAWSPAGQLTIARQLDAEVAVLSLDLKSSASRELLRFPWNSGVDGDPFFAWSPDGRYLLYSIHQYADVVVFDTRTGTPTTLLTGGAGLYDPASAWSRDGRLALVDADGQIVIARPDGSRVATIRLEAAEGSNSIGTRWAPDGSSLAATDFEHVIVTMNPDGSRQEAHPQVHNVDTLAWSPDSSWLAVQIRGAGEDHIAETRIVLYSPDGSPSRVLGPFTSTDGLSGGTFPCLGWED